MRVFFDNNLSPKLARALQALFVGEHEILALRDKYPQNITDVEWISALSKEGQWVVISGDRRITRNKAEQSAFRNSNLIGIFMASGLLKSPVIKQAERLLHLWTKIETISDTVQGGSMFELPVSSAKLGQIK